MKEMRAGMASWKAGHGTDGGPKLRPDWEHVKVDVMYRANLAKFSQHADLLALLVGTRGPITARGGLFWKTWNEAREAQS